LNVQSIGSVMRQIVQKLLQKHLMPRRTAESGTKAGQPQQVGAAETAHREDSQAPQDQQPRQRNSARGLQPNSFSFSKVL
jgi:hypothetical protein